MTAQQTRDFVNKYMFEHRDKLTENNMALVAAVVEIGARAQRDVCTLLQAKGHRRLDQVDKAIQSFTVSQVWNILLGRQDERPATSFLGSN